MMPLNFVVEVQGAERTDYILDAVGERMRLELQAYAERLAAYYTTGPRPAVTVRRLGQFEIIPSRP